jgi:hypothetical protein
MPGYPRSWSSAGMPNPKATRRALQWGSKPSQIFTFGQGVSDGYLSVLTVQELVKQGYSSRHGCGSIASDIEMDIRKAQVVPQPREARHEPKLRSANRRELPPLQTS